METVDADTIRAALEDQRAAEALWKERQHATMATAAEATATEKTEQPTQTPSTDDGGEHDNTTDDSEAPLVAQNADDIVVDASSAELNAEEVEVGAPVLPASPSVFDALLSPTSARTSSHTFLSPLVSTSSATAAAAIRSPTLAHEHELSAVNFAADLDDDDSDQDEDARQAMVWEEYQLHLSRTAAAAEAAAVGEMPVLRPPLFAPTPSRPSKQSSHSHSHSHSHHRSHSHSHSTHRSQAASDARRRARRVARHRRGCGKFRGYGPDSASPYSRSFDPLLNFLPQTRREWKQFALRYVLKPVLLATTATLTSLAVGYLYHWIGSKHDARLDAAASAAAAQRAPAAGTQPAVAQANVSITQQ